MKHNGPTYILTFEWYSLRRDLLRNTWIIILAGCIAFMGIYIAQRLFSELYQQRYAGSAHKKWESSTIDNLSVSADTANSTDSVSNRPSDSENYLPQRITQLATAVQKCPFTEKCFYE